MQWKTICSSNINQQIFETTGIQMSKISVYDNLHIKLTLNITKFEKEFSNYENLVYYVIYIYKIKNIAFILNILSVIYM
jgi:hypothetical protein